METIHPWLDPLEVRRLAEKLMERQKPEEENPDRNEPGFGAAFIGFTGAARAMPPEPRTDISVGTARAPAVFEAAPPETPVTSPPPLPEALKNEASMIEPAEPEIRPAEAGRRPFLDRLLSLDEWLAGQIGANGSFLLDGDGKTLFDAGNHERLHFLAKSLAQASRRQSVSTAHVHLKISSDSTLEVIPVESEFGPMVLGVVVPHPLDAETMDAVRGHLIELTRPARR